MEVRAPNVVGFGSATGRARPVFRANSIVWLGALALAIGANGCSLRRGGPAPAAELAADPNAKQAERAARREARRLAPVAVYDETARKIEAKVGGRFAVLLPTDFSTPMKWRIEPWPDPEVLRLVSQSYTSRPPLDCQGCKGYIGTRRFEFEVQGAAALRLRFLYRELSQLEGPGQREVTYDVTLTN
jgi:hypothetical protein